MQQVIMLVPGNEQGGAATHLLTLAKAIQRYPTNVQYTFVCFGEGPLTESLRPTNHDIHILTGSFRAKMQKLIKIMICNPDGILHSHGPRMNVLAATVAKKVGCLWTATIHSNPYLDYLSSRWKRRIFPWLHLRKLAEAVGLFVVNPALTHVLPVKTIAFVPNAIEWPELTFEKSFYEHKLKHQLGLADACQVIGIAARLDPVKDIPTLIRAVHHLKNQDIHLVIAGDGTERMELVKLVHALHMQSRIHFLGYVTQVIEFYAGLRMHILPSKSEGTPFSVLEAGALGVPTVGTDIPGLTHLLKNGKTGICVPVGDDLALASAIDRLLQKPDEIQSLVSAFQKDILPKYHPQKMVEAYARGYALFTGEGLRSVYKT